MLLNIDYGINGGWNFAHLYEDWLKEFGNIILWYTSADGKIIERGYIIPKWEIYDQKTKKGIKSLTIIKTHQEGSNGMKNI